MTGVGSVSIDQLPNALRVLVSDLDFTLCAGAWRVRLEVLAVVGGWIEGEASNWKLEDVLEFGPGER